jgi:HlyD family secretion protein
VAEDAFMTLDNKIKKRLRLAAGVALAAAVAWLAFEHWFGDNTLPEGLIQANGRIEGDRVIVAGKFAGRITRLLAREGDTVARDQVLVEMDDAQARARVNQARASLAALDAQVQLAAARAAQTARDAERFRELFREGTTSSYETEQAELAAHVARDQHAAAKAQRASAAAALVEAESVLADLTIKAPIAGTVLARMVDSGEVVGAGTPLLVLVDLDRLYLKVYVPEVEIGKLRLGLPARVYTDAFPDQPFAASVRHIASQAEFTPKEVQTPDERVKLVYAVKLYLTENPGHRLTPGLPADAVIRWDPDVPWERPRW